MRRQKDLTMKKIENQGENLYKLLLKCQMTDFCEKIDQLYVKLSLELNVIETNRLFRQKEGVNKIEMGIIKGPNGIGKCQRRRSIERKFKYVSTPPPLPPRT